MEIEVLIPITIGIFFVAVLYSSVGHAGASGYIAIMSLFSLPSSFVKPAALILNILVSMLAFWHFRKGGHFVWSLFWPFVLLSIPFAFIGGYLQLPAKVFEILVGIVLILSALRFLYGFEEDIAVSAPARSSAMGSGAGIGLLAGMTGTGGGIFLTPLMLLKRWSLPKQAAATSTLFIFANSVSGLAGNITSTLSLPLFTLPFIIAALAGGAIGSWFGSFRLPGKAIKHVLSAVLLVAGFKLIFA